jgi:phage host-nuclease inhibitor protein Gam
MEEGFRAVHEAKEAELGIAGLTAPRAEVQALVRRAEDAKLEAARIETENISKRAEAESEAAAKRAQIAVLDAQIATKRAELDAPTDIVAEP